MDFIQKHVYDYLKDPQAFWNEEYRTRHICMDDVHTKTRREVLKNCGFVV
jgi:hypothetical protein